MNNYALLIFLFAIALPFASVAQRFSMEQWHNGRVVVDQGDTISGSIKYDYKANTIQIIPESRSEAFALSAQKIIYADFIDKLDSRYRKFFSLPYDIMNNNYEVPVLFELLVEGPLTLLVRERMEMQTQVHPYYRSFSREILVYDFYFLDEGRKITKFDGRKRDLLSYMKPFEKEINDFIRDERINFDRRGDLVRVVLHYNQLKQNN